MAELLNTKVYFEIKVGEKDISVNLLKPSMFEHIFDNVSDLLYPSSGHSLTWDCNTGSVTKIKIQKEG